VQRILVVAMSGAGKTTAARRLATVLGLPFHEMDALAIGPGWSTPATLVQDVAAIVRGPAWVFDSWGYPQVRDAMWAAADTVVWLDYPRRVVLTRLLRRSLARSWRRDRIFGGNVERWRGWISRTHPFWHAVTTFGSRRAYLAERTDREAHLRIVRLRTPAEFETWLDQAIAR
jgi:adenylate kinase family enzyme